MYCLGWPVFHVCCLLNIHSQVFILKQKNEKNKFKTYSGGYALIGQYKLSEQTHLSWLYVRVICRKWVKSKLLRLRSKGRMVLLYFPPTHGVNDTLTCLCSIVCTKLKMGVRLSYHTKFLIRTLPREHLSETFYSQQTRLQL